MNAIQPQPSVLTFGRWLEGLRSFSRCHCKQRMEVGQGGVRAQGDAALDHSKARAHRSKHTPSETPNMPQPWAALPTTRPGLAFQYSSLASSLHEAARARGRGTLQSRSGGGRPQVCRITQEMSSTMACRKGRAPMGAFSGECSARERGGTGQRRSAGHCRTCRPQGPAFRRHRPIVQRRPRTHPSHPKQTAHGMTIR